MAPEAVCPGCGAVAPPEARFCRGCGAFLAEGKRAVHAGATQLPPVSPAPEPTRVTIGSGDTTTVPRRSNPPTAVGSGPPIPPPTSSSRAALYAAIAACTVALAAVGITLIVATTSGRSSRPSGDTPRRTVPTDSANPGSGDAGGSEPGTPTTVGYTATSTTTTAAAPPPDAVPPQAVNAITAVYDAFVRHDWNYARANFVNGAGTGPGQPDSYWDPRYGTLQEYRLVPSRVRPDDGATVVGLVTHEVGTDGSPFSWEFCLAFRVDGDHVQQVGRATVRGRVEGWVDFDTAEAVVSAC